MKKVLMVSCEGLGNGGVQTVMMQIIRSLNKEYTFDALLFTDEVRFYDEEFLSYGGKIYRMPKYTGNHPLKARFDVYFRYFLLYGKMKKLFKENGYDVIHCHNEYEAAICMKAAKKAGVKIRISHAHTEYEPLNFFSKMLNKGYKRMLLKNATHFIGASKSACTSYYGSDSNFTVINNPYDDCRYVYSDAKSDKLVILQAGNFTYNKNQLFTLKIFKKVLDKYPDAILHLVGKGTNDYSSKVQNFIKENNLESKVFQYEPNADIYDVMSKSSLLVMPSLKEGFGIVLIEAQAVGLNCYASDTIPPLTNVGGCTYLSLTDGENVWAEKIIEDFENGKIFRREYDMKKFKTKNIVDKYRKMYGGN